MLTKAKSIGLIVDTSSKNGPESVMLTDRPLRQEYAPHIFKKDRYANLEHTGRRATKRQIISTLTSFF